MGSPSTDYSSKYAPTINNSTKTEIISGIQSEDLGNIVKQLTRLFESKMNRESRELQDLRNENQNIRNSLSRAAESQRSNDTTVRRNDQTFATENKRLDTRYSTDSQRLSNTFAIDNKRLDNSFATSNADRELKMS